MRCRYFEQMDQANARTCKLSDLRYGSPVMSIRLRIIAEDPCAPHTL